MMMGRGEGTEAGPEEDFGHCGWELGVGMESGQLRRLSNRARMGGELSMASESSVKYVTEDLDIVVRKLEEQVGRQVGNREISGKI